MIRFVTAHPDGQPIVFLGMTVEDLERLVRREDPIVVSLGRLGLADVDVTLFFASDEAVEAMKVRQQASTNNEGEPPDEHDNGHEHEQPRRGRRWRR